MNFIPLLGNLFPGLLGGGAGDAAADATNFKGATVTYGENVGNGDSFMYGDISNANMSFQHGWPKAIAAIPDALKEAKYFTTGSDFTGTTYDSYISFDVDEPVIVVGMYNASESEVDASNFATDGWTICRPKKMHLCITDIDGNVSKKVTGIMFFSKSFLLAR